MRWIISLFDKTGSLGVLTATLGCASCFPALGSFGAAIGLGFLHQYEGLFLNTLLPIFAVFALLANVYSYFNHKIWYRTLAGVAGPTMVLLTMYPLWAYDWSTYLLYAGIALMLIVSLWDIFSPADKVCGSCEITDAQTNA
ncbi:MAG: organomercurial transporter MerC [Gammaproteobacteria bacterium]|nr:MAG: organomercurial transporter MerC [Gammaproteobacteria bacterium]